MAAFQVCILQLCTKYLNAGCHAFRSSAPDRSTAAQTESRRNRTWSIHFVYMYRYSSHLDNSLIVFLSVRAPTAALCEVDVTFQNLDSSEISLTDVPWLYASILRVHESYCQYSAYRGTMKVGHGGFLW